MRAPPIALTRSDLSGLTWIALEGDLDLAGAGLVGEDLHRICDASRHLVIDARGLRFIDLAGLRLLAALGRRQRERGARLSIVPSPLVTRLARLTGMQPVLDDSRDAPDALLGLGDAAADAARTARFGRLAEGNRPPWKLRRRSSSG